ncbi:MAG: hypothetical protein AB7G37_12275 [Solirubrobacteraceae bacterium]
MRNLRIGPLGIGEIVALLGLVVLVVSALPDWFSLDRVDVCQAAVRADEGPLSAETCAILTRARGLEDSTPVPGTSLSITALGQPWFGLLVVAAWGALLTVVAALRGPGRRLDPRYIAGATVLAGIVLVTTVVRVLAARPTSDATILVEPAQRVEDLDLGIAGGAWIGIVGLAVVVVGLLLVVADVRRERATGAHRRLDPRPAPGAADGPA